MSYKLDRFYKAVTDPRCNTVPKLVVSDGKSALPIEIPVRFDTIEYNRSSYDDSQDRLSFKGVAMSERDKYAFVNGNRVKAVNNSVHVDRSFQIKKVIFNEPATIVFWQDGTKTVVKTQNEEDFDPEKGLAMAIAKKAMGNEGNYFNRIKKWTEKYYDERLVFCFEAFNASLDAVKEALGLKKNPEPVKCDVMSEEKEVKTEGRSCFACKYLETDGGEYPCWPCGPDKSNWEPKPDGES